MWARVSSSQSSPRDSETTASSSTAANVDQIGSPDADRQTGIPFGQHSAVASQLCKRSRDVTASRGPPITSLNSSSMVRKSPFMPGSQSFEWRSDAPNIGEVEDVFGAAVAEVVFARQLARADVQTAELLAQVSL